MPNCFQLFPKGSKEPVQLTKVDEAICEHLDVPVHPTQWVAGWFDTIGFQCAMGNHLGTKEIRERIAQYNSPTVLLTILDYLEANYSSDAWYETK